MEIIKEFPFSDPEVKCRINRIYNSSFPGSLLYDLTSKKTSQLVNSWSVSVRHMWRLPLNSHRYLMEPLGGKHAYSMLISRYIKFIQNMICKSDKPAVQLMFNMIRDNMSTTTGRNVRHIEDLFQCDILKIDDKLIKTKLVFSSNCRC